MCVGRPILGTNITCFSFCTGAHGRTFIRRHRCPLRTYICMSRHNCLPRNECPGDSGAWDNHAYDQVSQDSIRNLLVCNATCSDTYAPSHLAQFTMAAGAVAGQAEDRKKVYLEGHPGICFTPITYETSGVVGPLSLIFTVDTKNYSYLLQRLSVAIQRGNDASIIGTLFSPSSTDF